MAIDIQGLNDALLKTSKNYDEAVRKWVELALAPAKDVPIEYYDPNGNLVQTTVPNRAKLFNELLVNINSAMKRTYYVDAVNGSDNNDGSSTAPFKTIKKAVDSVPVGGNVRIVLLNDYVLNTTEVIEKRYVSLEATAPVTLSNIETTVNINGTDYRSATGFVITNAVVRIEGITLNEVTPTQNLPSLYYGSSLIRVNGSNIWIYNSTINLPSDSYYSLIHFDTWKGVWGAVALRQCSITTNGASVVRLINNAGVGLFIFNTAINDNTKWVSGVIKDTNGVPRNVLSNLVL